MSYRLIPPHGGDIVKPIISIKPRLNVRFGLTMMKYAFKSPPTKVGLKVNMINVQTTGNIYRHI